MLSPLLLCRQGDLRICHLAAILFTKLLSQLHSPCRAELHALAAGHAFGFIHPCHIGRAGHIGRVKKLGGPQGITYVHITVADSKNFVGPVNIGDLMDKAVVLRLSENVKRFLSGNQNKRMNEYNGISATKIVQIYKHTFFKILLTG